MSEITLTAKIIISAVIFGFLPSVLFANDFPFLVQICTKPNCLFCFAVYVRRHYLITTDVCSWKTQYNLYPENALMIGPFAPACNTGEHRQAAKIYVDPQSVDYINMGMVVIKISEPFNLGATVAMIDIAFYNKNIGDCYLFSITRDHVTEEDKIEILNVTVSDIRCPNTTINGSSTKIIMKCVVVPESTDVWHSPVICDNVLHGFVVDVADSQALIYHTSSQADWLSIALDGATLKTVIQKDDSEEDCAVSKKSFFLTIPIVFICAINTIIIL